MQTSLQGIAKKAQSNKKHRFGNLFEMLNEEMLHDCWRYIRKDAACGVDRVPIPVLGKLAEAFIIKQNERELELVLANLKARMET